jgi:hypothetical protein
MTITDRIDIRRKAAVMRRWLQAKGISVIENRVVNKTPVLVVSGPVPSELTSHVLVITEKLNGLERRAWLARLGGCCIHWREQ